MTKEIHEALDLALEALTIQSDRVTEIGKKREAIAAIKQARSAPTVQEPVAWRTFDGEGGYDYRTYDMNEDYAKEWNERNPNHKGWVEPLYTTPPAQPAVPLTDEQKLMCWSRATHDADVEHKTEHQCLMDYGSEIESAHGIAAAPEKGQP